MTEITYPSLATMNEHLERYGVRIDPLLYTTDYIVTLADRPDLWGRFRDWTLHPHGGYNPDHVEAGERAWQDFAARLREGVVR